ncbi:hypothetical protein PRUPE_3G120800 [Prunus persica]|uniref:Uncharacterized protein n=1 Tax=Prunus persica TaxID=3760 RepID=A0A251PYW4_PRUPE|nr:hypothetical protein PRUPE_3G120800 [Prunus persica]
MPFGIFLSFMSFGNFLATHKCLRHLAKFHVLWQFFLQHISFMQMPSASCQVSCPFRALRHLVLRHASFVPLAPSCPRHLVLRRTSLEHSVPSSPLAPCLVTCSHDLRDVTPADRHAPCRSCRRLSHDKCMASPLPFSKHCADQAEDASMTLMSKHIAL